MAPAWLNDLSIAFLAASAASAAVVIVDIVVLAHRQAMWIMDVVWPVTALWAGPLAVLAYFRWGRAGERRAVRDARERHDEPPNTRQPFPVLVAKGATHCGSGAPSATSPRSCSSLPLRCRSSEAECSAAGSTT